MVEAQRKYLGGDSEHSILVKGLDFALLEQNKARSTLTNDDVDALDQAYLESSQHESAAGKKRTREDLIKELKEQRAGKSEQPTPAPKGAEEETKQKGKFKPIGFKPIGQSSDTKKKSKSNKSDGTEGEKKKKRKADGGDVTGKTKTTSTSMPPPPIAKAVKPEEPVDNDFDIFAGAGEYEGIDIGDDDDEDAGALLKAKGRVELEEGEEPSTSSVPRRWIENDEPRPATKQNILHPSMQLKNATSGKSPTHEREVSEGEGAEESRPMRLAPLASSALPSIKEFLAMDKAADSYEKKRKRKDKKKSGRGDDDDDDESSTKKKDVEAKVERDYKRLKSFTDKKTAGSK
ncbi:hypothetical protein GALMADRAFT_241103 [Galerina marginata CBS 339.88]|uniref:RED-like N-terminal domain-containing protein n=1 Tax=Galerina marginata (strain CBS 339.88) TaxID=685588 RepID=A0A067TC16_GALM3|nr:hypothetical protein GALMADRAFT_241103 [Galerina marginata CBS 339.88]